MLEHLVYQKIRNPNQKSEILKSMPLGSTENQTTEPNQSLVTDNDHSDRLKIRAVCSPDSPQSQVPQFTSKTQTESWLKYHQILLRFHGRDPFLYGS
jgi:hypothetical protein